MYDCTYKYSRPRFDDENCFGMRRYTALRKQVVMLLIVKRKRLGVRINELFSVHPPPPTPSYTSSVPLYIYFIYIPAVFGTVLYTE